MLIGVCCERTCEARMFFMFFFLFLYIFHETGQPSRIGDGMIPKWCVLGRARVLKTGCSIGIGKFAVQSLTCMHVFIIPWIVSSSLLTQRMFQ